ncbi:hypothetical protein Tco_0233988, partial [Tanacetum coccineum]
GLLTDECALLKVFDIGFAPFTLDLEKAVLTGLAVLTDTAAFEKFYLAVLIGTVPDLVKTAIRTKFLFGCG